MSGPRAVYAERREASSEHQRRRNFAAEPPLIPRSARDKLKKPSRAHLFNFTEAVAEQLLLIVRGDSLAQDLLGAIARELSRVFGELVPRVLEAVVHLSLRLRDDLLRFVFCRDDELAALLLAFDQRAFVNRLHFFFELRQPRLNVVRDLVGLLPPRLRVICSACDVGAAIGESLLYRTADEVHQRSDEEKHVEQLEDP